MRATKEAYKLIHEGVLALAECEHNGIRIDMAYLNDAIEKTKNKIKTDIELLKQDPIYTTWKKHFGQDTKLGSREQLGTVLFKIMKIETDNYTVTGKYKMDAGALEKVDHPFVKKYLAIESTKKACSTYLLNIQREVCDGFLHPNFNMHLVETFRSSSSTPNFQNIPIRDPIIGRLIRRSFIPRRNSVIIETDYNGAEIRSSACYHHDPQMIKYINDKSTDMHRDMAMQLYMLDAQSMTKDARTMGKTYFVFPQFYGDYYLQCARNLWNAIHQQKLVTTDGVPLKKHLRRNGIRELGDCIPKNDPRPNTFEAHVKAVEDDFWNVRFPVYNEWKKKLWDEYQANGYIETLTGFYICGDYRRNQIINSPIQGTAFHWLLWSLIKLVKTLKKYKMKTKVIGQIHDSIISDVHEKEVADYMDIIYDIMTQQVRKHWSWICVPLEIENGITPLDGSWYDKIETEKQEWGFSFKCPSCKSIRKYKTQESLLMGLSNSKCKKCT